MSGARKKTLVSVSEKQGQLEGTVQKGSTRVCTLDKDVKMGERVQVMSHASSSQLRLLIALKVPG